MRREIDAAARHELAKKGCTYQTFADRFGLTASGAKMWMSGHGYKQIHADSNGRECLDPPTEKHAYMALFLAIVKDMTVPVALRKIAS